MSKPGGQTGFADRLSMGWLGALLVCTACSSPGKPLLVTMTKSPAPLAQGMRITPQIDRNYAVQARYSPDGHYILVNGLLDASLWDVDKEIIVRTFEVGSGGITAIGWLPNGSSVILASTGGAIDIVRLADGSVQQTLPGSPGDAYAVAVSPDGKRVAAVTESGQLRLWDIASARLLAEQRGHGAPEGELVYTSAGRQLASVGAGEIRLWHADTLAPMGRLPIRLSHVDVSPDGRRIIGDCGDLHVCLWDVVADASGRATVGEPRWRVRAHHGSLAEGLSAKISSVAFSPDGRLAASSAVGHRIRDARDLTAGILWDPDTGQELQRVGDDYFTGFSVDFAPDGETWLIAGTDNRPGHVGLASPLRLVSVASRGEAPETTYLGGHTTPLHTVAWLPDGRSLVLGGVDGTARSFDLELGRLREFRGHGAEVVGVAVDRAGEVLVTAGRDDHLGIWQLDAPRSHRFFGEQRDRITAVAMSADARRVVTAGEHMLAVWDREQQGFHVRAYEHEDCEKAKRSNTQLLIGGVNVECLLEVNSLALDASGRRAIMGSNDGVLRLWDIGAGKAVARETIPGGDVTATAMMTTGQCAASGSGDGVIRLWHVSKGRSLREAHKRAGHRGAVLALAFSASGRWLASGGEDGIARVWDAEKGHETARLTGHLGPITGVAFSPDERLLASVSEDGTARVWNLADGTSATLIASGSDWLLYTDDGYFDASASGGRFVAVAQGTNAFPIEQLAVVTNRPDVILTRLGLGSDSLRRHYASRYQRRRAQLGITGDPGQLGGLPGSLPTARIESLTVEDGWARLTAKLDDRTELARWNVYVNGSALFPDGGKPIRGTSVRLSERFPLTAGANRVEVSAFNGDGFESLRNLRVVHNPGEAAAITLHFIGIGVADYRDDRFDLNFSDDDIRLLAATFDAMQGTAGIDRVVSHTLIDSQVTPDGIAALQSLLAEAAIDDIVVVAVTGHGLWSTGIDAAYYFLTHDARLDDLPGTAASFALIEGLLSDIKPRRKLLLVDTCESGERVARPADEAISVSADRVLEPRTARGFRLETARPARGPAPRELAALNRNRYIYNDLLRRTGAVVFSSSTDQEFSYESKALGQGVFTAKLVEALTTGAADEDSNGLVTMAELKAWLPRAVGEYTRGYQNPTVDRDNLHSGLAFPIVSRQR
jgi:WD40 repeat protein